MTTTELQTLAKTNKEQIHSAIYNLRANFLVLGRLLKENRDMALWKTEYDSFEGFLGDPEVSMKRSWAYGLIQIYELFVDKLGIPAERLLKIEPAKLLKVAPVVESDPEEWLAKAEHLSLSDLSIERGRTERKKLSSPAPSGPGPDKCAICGAKEWEKSHFPITRGAGAKESHWIPMCRNCHDEFHRGAETFILNYKRRWSDYYYERISRD